MLFTHVDRSDVSPMRGTETDIAFLDRSARPEVERVRQLLNAILENYPTEHAGDLINRIRSGDSRHFRSACFELLIHEFLLRLGFSLTPHPELPNGSGRRPDFLVRCPDGAMIYLEAASASEDNGQDAGADCRKRQTLDVLNAATHPAFMVAIDSKGDPTTQPSGNRLGREVVTWLNTLDPDALLTRIEEHGSESLPEMRWRQEGWEVRVRPIPVQQARRGGQRRLIGIRGFGAGWVNAWAPLRDSVVAKSRHYGELALPLVIAVNADTFALDPIDEVQALFGQEQFVFSTAHPDAEPRFERAPNGAWRGIAGPRARRASAAWFFPDLTPFTVAGRRQRLYLNPWAHFHAPESFLRMPHSRTVEGHLQSTAGVELGQVLGLHPGWPESSAN